MADFACDYSDQEGEHGAQFLLTNLENGDTQKLCSVHLPTWAASLLEALGCTVTMPDAEEVAPPASEGAAAPDPPPTKSGQEDQQAIPPELQAAASPFSEVAADDG